MIYKVADNKIFVYDRTQFDPQHSLECGQIFRYEKTEEGYRVFSKDLVADIIDKKTYYVIESENPAYFVRFFDLDTDYNEIKKQLNVYPVMVPALKFGSGIRILRQDSFEALISFIISANNNIKRIQSIMEALCKKVGTKKKGFYAFPTKEQLMGLSVDDFRALGLGYRAAYVYKVLKQITPEFCEIATKDTTKAANYLIALSGIGPKVADCILLFGFHKTDLFPVDTWIDQVYHAYFAKKHENSRVKIRQNLVKIFGEYSGYAQQYLFYHKRSGK